MTGDDLAPKGVPELATILKGVFDGRRFLDLIKNFVMFGNTGSDVVRILAGYSNGIRVPAATSKSRLSRKPAN